MTIIDYRKRLGLGYSDAEKHEHFIAYIHNFFLNASADHDSFPPLIEQAFCNKIGERMEDNNDWCTLEEPTGLPAAWKYLKKRTDIFLDFLFCYVMLINCYGGRQKNIKNVLTDELLNALDECQIPYEVVHDDDGLFVFPKGAKELDEALVSEPLEWLKDYPATRKTYVIALKQYSDGIYIRDVADNLRKALESFLQEFLKNTKNLETNKNEICKYLGGQGVDAGISGLFQPLINAYKNMNDKIAKHNDAVDAKLLEFLLYQTGILIRMVLSVKQAQETEVLDHAD